MNLQAATVGCGRMGALHTKTVSDHAPEFWMPISHLAAISKIEGIDPVACCDVLEESRLRAKKQFSVARDYADALEMLSKEKLDILTIATRTPEKPSLIQAAIDAGVRAIHVEKPLCNSVNELMVLSEKIQSSNVLFTFGCLRRYLPPYKFARRYAKAKEFGNLVDVHIEMGNAPLMWGLVHGLDQLLYFCHPAKPMYVNAWFEELEKEKGSDFTIHNDPKFISAAIMFDNGISGRIGRTSGDSITISSNSSRIEVFGDGAQVFTSDTSKNGIYQTRYELDWKRSCEQIEYGGSAAPLQLLKTALEGCKTARKTVNEATEAMLDSQNLIFDLLWSHLQDGRVVKSRHYPVELEIKGVSHGRPA